MNPIAAGVFGIPKRSGKLKELSAFDAAFFGVSPKQAHMMDPQLRILLEVTHEAIVDAGEARRVPNHRYRTVLRCLPVP